MMADLFGDMGAMGTTTPKPTSNQSKTIAKIAENTSDFAVFNEEHSTQLAAPASTVENSKSIACSSIKAIDSLHKHNESIDAKASSAIEFDVLALPSIERIHTVLVAHGVDGESLPAGLLAAVAQLVTEAQTAPADLPPADRLLCWVMDSELAEFAPMRVRRALAPFGTNNGERMIPLYAPAPNKAV